MRQPPGSWRPHPRNDATTALDGAVWAQLTGGRPSPSRPHRCP